jgi:glutathione peroxidase
MKKHIIVACAVFAAAIYSTAQVNNKPENRAPVMKTLYDFKATDIEGKEFDMSQLKGKKVMIVNVASECGYTPQYAQLEELYERYKDKGLVILGFPCNQFAGQEPGDEEKIKSFCQKNYGVTFPLFSKIDVKGKDQHPIYQWLTEKELNGVENSEVSWNFNKYLIDGEGHYVKHLKSGVTPLDEEVLSWVEGK